MSSFRPRRRGPASGPNQFSPAVTGLSGENARAFAASLEDVGARCVRPVADTGLAAVDVEAAHEDGGLDVVVGCAATCAAYIVVVIASRIGCKSMGVSSTS